MVALQNIVKQYGTLRVVDGLTLTIPRGKVFGFLGQNGAGKTTTIKMIVGLAEPTAGSITIGGKSVARAGTRQAIGFMPEAPYFYDRLTGLEFLHFCGELFGLAQPNSAYEKIMRDVGIFDARHRAIATYSKGMKQRLGFGQALVNDPEYIFLDEPLDGLDPIGRKEIKDIIIKLKAAGKTIFFNSHILYDTEALCDDIGIIHAGRLLYAGSVRDFCAGRPLEERFVAVIEAHKKKTGT